MRFLEEELNHYMELDLKNRRENYPKIEGTNVTLGSLLIMLYLHGSFDAISEKTGLTHEQIRKGIEMITKIVDNPESWKLLDKKTIWDIGF